MRRLLTVAIAILAACAGAPTRAPKPAAAAGPEAVPLPPPPRTAGPSAGARRLFDEAVQAAEEQAKLQIPTDWVRLERKWRAAAEPAEIPEAAFNLGVCQERLGKRDEARASYRRALEIAPAYQEAASNLALLDEPADPRAALGSWRDFLRRFPGDAVALSRLAGLYAEAGQDDEAVRLAREALLRDGHQVGALKVMMRVALHRGNSDLALLLALRAGKLDPADPEIPAATGRALAAQGDETRAAAQWRRAVALRPDYAPAHAELLRLALARQHWAGAAEEARALLRADPSNPRLELVLGVALRYLGDADGAAAAYDRAEKLAGGRLPEVHLARGVLLMRVRERCEPALAELRRYVTAGGPAVLADGTAGRLERECEQILAAGRAAEEEAQRMKAEAERKKEPPRPPPPGKP